MTQDNSYKLNLPKFYTPMLRVIAVRKHLQDNIDEAVI